MLAFFVELAQPSEAALQSFIQAWGVVPREYSGVRDLPPTIPLPFWSTLVTSMFLHGGWMHLGGNMLYLWIFGDNLEKVMGAVRFAIFYLVCGLVASFAHIIFGPGSTVPAVGASGAISGVLGGYLVLFPRNQVRVLTRGGIAHVPPIVVLVPGLSSSCSTALARWPPRRKPGRRGAHGAHWRFRRGACAGQADGFTPAAVLA